MEQTKTIPDLVVVQHKEGKLSQPEAGLKRRVLAYNEKLFLAEHEMVKGWAGTLHSHRHDQIVYVVHGHLKVSCQGRRFESREISFDLGAAKKWEITFSAQTK